MGNSKGCANDACLIPGFFPAPEMQFVRHGREEALAAKSLLH